VLGIAAHRERTLHACPSRWVAADDDSNFEHPR
jgi:hypothetical protein